MDDPTAYVGRVAQSAPRAPATKFYPAPPGDPPAPIYSPRGPILRPPPGPGGGGSLFLIIQSLMGYGDKDFSFWIVPRGYGMTALSVASCYCLVIWERIKVEKLSKKPIGQKNTAWYSTFQSMEREYQSTKSDFIRVVILAAIGGIGLPYATALGALCWCAGRATKFYESQQFRFHKIPMLDAYRNAEQEEPVLCRFGKFLMLCGIVKFGYDYCRGKLSAPRLR